MIVSWNWLREYVPLEIGDTELVERLSLAGLNHESTTAVGDDLAIDLEVTSNRPDWLGHLGIAREIAAVLQTPFTRPDPKLPSKQSVSGSSTGSKVVSASGRPGASGLPQVRIDAPQLCRRYTARLICGVRVGASPTWLKDRLATIGIGSVNNIVDVTNYVMMECGQPLHAFDAAKIGGNQIIVRAAAAQEPFVAIDHREYTLNPTICVIADAQRAVALGGVMGGADSEVSDQTVDVLIEAADFDPVSVRNAARALNLHSPSSHRFERGVDPAGVDWASRRCCELMIQVAGGDCLDEVADVTAAPPAPPACVTLRFDQIKRVLGIEVPAERVRAILARLGTEQTACDDKCLTVRAPSWRPDLTREVDLIEEVARIHGYDHIPEDVGVQMVSSGQRDVDRVMSRIRTVVAAGGFDEAMTCSVVSDELSSAFSPWTEAEALQVTMPMLRGASCLRRSLIPSLLEARRINENLSNPTAELYEVAKVYLPRPGTLPIEPTMLALVSGRDFRDVKGILESMLGRLHVAQPLLTEDCQLPLATRGAACQLKLGTQAWGFMATLSDQGRKAFKLRGETCIAEVRIDVMQEAAVLIPQYQAASAFPGTTRDLNLIVDEHVRWDQIARTVHQVCGQQLDELHYLQTYRDPNQDGPGKKRILFRFQLRSKERTLTGEEADATTSDLIAACRQQLGAQIV